AFTLGANVQFTGGTVQFTNAASVASLGGTLTVNGGTIDFSSGTAVSLTTLALNSGAVQGSDAVTLTGAGSTWTGGNLGSSAQTGTYTIANGATLTVSGALTKQLQRSLTVAVGGLLVLSDATTITQNGGTITNSGTIRKIGAAGTTGTLNAVTSSGLMESQGGILSLVNGGTISGGTVQASAGATVQFAGGTTTVTGAFTLGANVQFTGGTVQFTNAASVSSLGGTLTVNGGTIDFSTGTAVSLATL